MEVKLFLSHLGSVLSWLAYNFFSHLCLHSHAILLGGFRRAKSRNLLNEKFVNKEICNWFVKMFDGEICRLAKSVLWEIWGARNRSFHLATPTVEHCLCNVDYNLSVLLKLDEIAAKDGSSRGKTDVEQVPYVHL